MPRRGPSIEPAPLRRSGRGEEFTVALRTTTWMFGGSAAPGTVENQRPVRVASVRGHLRFWWRALFARRFGSSAELFAAEEQLWGSASLPGTVQLWLDAVKPGTSRDVWAENADADVLRRGLGYAVFPFQGQANPPKKPDRCLTETTFTIGVRCPVSAADDVRQSLRAWVAFGGIGSRTRRGCGSLAFVDPANQGLPALDREGVATHPMLSEVPAQVYLGRPQVKPLEAWVGAISIYRDFRQGVGIARNPGDQPNRPGRSRWPEPDSIRRLSHRHADRHRPTHPVDGFPRADLGLPIIFHFAPSDKGDPADHTLEGPERGRLASPVITKAIQWQGGYRPMIAILDGPHAGDSGNLTLRSGQQTHQIGSTSVMLPAAERSQIPPLNGEAVRHALAKLAVQRGLEPTALPTGGAA